MDLGRLKAFLTVARWGNLSAAARELGMTQPNLGRQMTALAKEVEMDLFVRHSRGLELTQRGKDFFELCQRIVGELEQETANIREKDSEPQGYLRIVTGIGSTEAILEKLDLFSQQFPKIKFLFSSTTEMFRVQIGAADVGILPVASSDPDLIQHHLYDMDLRFFASPKYLELHNTPKTFQDLKFHRMIVYTSANNEIFKPLNLMPSEIGPNKDLNFDIYDQPFIGVNNGTNMRKALVKGLGIGTYTYHRELIENNLLVDVFPNMPPHKIPHYYTYHKRLEGSPKIHEFHKFLQELCNIWVRPV